MKKLKVLFQGWILQHSYAIVNAFQLVHFYKKYKDTVEMYVEERALYRESWNSKKKLVFPDEYNEILTNLRRYNGEEVDIVYSITYPYNLTPIRVNGKRISKVVFYTSEFACLDASYFVYEENGETKRFKSDKEIIEHLKNNPEIKFTSPSLWSSMGMKRYMVSDEKNKIITHGVDTSIFRMNTTKRQSIRGFYGVKDDDILLINTGAMTQNKGVLLILQVMNELVCKRGRSNFKLLLKGTGDLYQCKEYLETYFEDLQKANVITKEEMNTLLEHNIIFTDKTLTFEKMNDLFNAADLCISPYLAEGFGLVPLESLASGLKVLVPQTGSTREYIADIYNNGGHNFIYYVESQLVNQMNSGFLCNQINVEDIVRVLLENEKQLRVKDTYEGMYEYISKNYNWGRVVEMLHEYLIM